MKRTLIALLVALLPFSAAGQEPKPVPLPLEFVTPVTPEQKEQEEIKVAEGEEPKKKQEEQKPKQGRIEVDPTDTPLILTGRLEAGKEFVGTVRLTARDADVTGFHFLPGDLTGGDGQPKIARSSVVLVGAPNLTKGVPTDVQVKVSGVPRAGDYEGIIALLPPGRPVAEAATIRVKLTATPVPDVSLVESSKTLTMSLVNCGNKIDCGLAHLLLPKTAFDDSRRIFVENKGDSAVVVEGVVVIVHGEKTGAQLTDETLVLPSGRVT
ncbi:MAG TPA: hypothetical protein P5340_07525, partial [Defluviicoccus sp.]|nr:hypothetical protein [Defluviicoccus sp.]